MEKELEQKVKFVEQHTSRLSERTDKSNLEEQNVKEILRDVLNELYYSKTKKEM